LPDGTVCIGEICDSAYDHCDGPVWEGSIACGYETFDLSLALGRDSYGECIITGTVNGDEQIPVAAGGCKSLSATIELYDGTTISVGCKVCNCAEELRGTCLSFCEDVPNVLYAEVSASEWSLMLGCNDAVPCFATITIQLNLIFVVTQLNPAGEYRWLGCGFVQCHDCNPLTADKQFKVCIDLGCDGSIIFTVNNDTSTNTEEFVYTLPCGVDAVWDVQFETSSLFGDPLDGCCDEANFIVVITE